MASYIGLRAVVLQFVGLLHILGVVELEAVHARALFEGDDAGRNFILQSDTA